MALNGSFGALVVSLSIIVGVAVFGIIAYLFTRIYNMPEDTFGKDINNFLDNMEREKPIRFTSKQLKTATENFSNVLGSGAFGTVYKGTFKNGLTVAVKVLHGTLNRRIEEQFMAELLYTSSWTMALWTTILFKTNEGDSIGFEKLHEIAMGTASGITYLHEECPQRIVHYDIKPGNILLDSKFRAKVADFGLAKLCNRENTHISMTGGRGTPGYAAPELWMPLPVTHKCDVYSFGMLLFEIIGRRRNMDVTLGDSQQWFPIWAWNKYEKKQLKDLMVACEIEENDQEVVDRMLKVALCCVQYRPETRPVMSIVVKMLEGTLEVPEPSNPFSHLFIVVSEPSDSLARIAWNGGGSDWTSSETIMSSKAVTVTPLMHKYEITIASE
ncbi:serine-threonine/tyrosine-protein kinase catalytic domain-containing protein [Artemisia annua]|uniref:Serine-threonine/tyrosine-protein kinase catalytic domain-containing protein n=1 Tax=Artemisia annua TaxID=35608 RepID=A0A2U1KNV9_ARTAN|nr:serine-threonine/tyrosine-protein kinase catalytic domain-containing protein [Artemisia annua]